MIMSIFMFYYQKKGIPSENPFLFRKEFLVTNLSIVLQQRSPKVTCTHTGRVTSSIIHHFKAQSVLSSELHDATFRILCEKIYGPLNMGTVIIAQKGMMISFDDKKNTYRIKFMSLGCI